MIERLNYQRKYDEKASCIVKKVFAMKPHRILGSLPDNFTDTLTVSPEVSELSRQALEQSLESLSESRDLTEESRQEIERMIEHLSSC